MLGIPELENMICRQLGLQDLALCARVRNPKKAIVGFTLSRVRHLDIQLHFYLSGPEVWKLLDRLDQCQVLRSLVIKVELYAGIEDVKEERTKDELKGWVSLKDLTLDGSSSARYSDALWSWPVQEMCKCGKNCR
ncbi:MAG: hypothetical protein J3Q66DRAFT_404524 [Benniella sp.]|nr:MAG: hypothetical protein J3Q66DRAFT_404524 [Benniella sp.]